jgi:hypothetical protein
MLIHLSPFAGHMARSLLAAAIFTCLACSEGAADARAITSTQQAHPQTSPAETGPPLWEFGLVAYARFGPSYPASEESQLNVIPLPYPIYRGKILRMGDDTDKPVRTHLFRRDRIKLDLNFGGNFAADGDNIDARTGMPDLDLLVEMGPELEFQLTPEPFGGKMFLSLQARGAVSLDGLNPDWRGVVYSTEFKFERRFRSSGFILRLNPEWGSENYMDFFYGVAPAYATPQRPAYEAGSGYLGTRLGLTLRHAITRKFDIVGGLRFGFYQGAANADSPLFTQKTTSGVMLALIWKFWASEKHAAARDDQAIF